MNALAHLAIFMVIFYFFIDKPNEPDPKPRYHTDKAAVATLESLLHDSDSVVYLDKFQNGSATCGTLKAKNKLGQYVTQRFIALPGFAWVEDSTADFGRHWREVCVW